jgi:AAA+ ATPase superfamily predicted ATPase
MSDLDTCLKFAAAQIDGARVESTTGKMWRSVAKHLIREPHLSKEEIFSEVIEEWSPNKDCLDFIGGLLQDAKHEFILDWKRINRL